MTERSYPLTGASASRGDLVRNLTTGRIGTVHCGSQFGRIVVNLDHGGCAKWERWNTEVLRTRAERLDIEP